MGHKLLPHTTIRDRMDKKDLRFQAEARKIKLVKDLLANALEAQEVIIDKAMDKWALKLELTPLTHEQRQELIRRPITFNYYGGKSSGGTSVLSEDYHRSIGGGVDAHLPEGSDYD